MLCGVMYEHDQLSSVYGKRVSATTEDGVDYVGASHPESRGKGARSDKMPDYSACCDKPADLPTTHPRARATNNPALLPSCVIYHLSHKR